MRTTPGLPRLLIALLVLTMLVSACSAPTAAPVAPAPTQAPAATAVPPTQAPAALDMNAAVTKYISTLPDGFGTIAAAKLNEQIAAAKPFILDVREPAEITKNGTIEGAVNIPVRQLAKNLDKLPTDKAAPIVAMCAIGHRGALAMAALQMLGYTNVKSLAGGFNAWKAANLPVAAAAAAPTAGKAADVDKTMLAAMDKYLSGLPEGFGTIAPAALNEQMAAAKPFILDVREASEVTKAGKIEGAVNIPVRTLPANLDKLPQDKAAPIVVYCAIGHRGALAMMALQEMGYTNVKSLAGGLTAWAAAKLPVVN